MILPFFSLTFLLFLPHSLPPLFLDHPPSHDHLLCGLSSPSLPLPPSTLSVLLPASNHSSHSPLNSPPIGTSPPLLAASHVTALAALPADHVMLSLDSVTATLEWAGPAAPTVWMGTTTSHPMAVLVRQ